MLRGVGEVVQVTGAQCRGDERDEELSFSLGLPLKAPSVKAALRAVGSQQEKSWGVRCSERAPST